MSEKTETPEEMFELGKRFYLPSSGVADPLLALYYFTKAAENGYIPAQRVLGTCYLEGGLTAPDYEKARQWLTSAARQNDGQAAYQLALLYMRGLGVEKDWDVAFKLLSMRCAKPLADVRILKEQMKGELIKRFPEIKAQLDEWERKRRAAFSSHRLRFIQPWDTPNRPQLESEEFEIWLKVNIQAITPQEAVSALLEMMKSYYEEQEAAHPAQP